MNIEIALATETEIDELEDLYNDLNDFLAKGTNYPGWKKGIYPVRETATEGVKQGNLYVAKHGGLLAGTVILNHKPDPAYQNAHWAFESDYSDVLVIHTFAVHPDFQRYGVGRALLDFSFELGKKTQTKAVRLDVYEGNAPAIRLYERCGFHYVDTVDLGLGSIGLKWFKLFEKLL